MKTLNTLILFLITINLTFAQTDLYVSTDSYIFVDGDGFASGTTVAPLYVTNGIQLAANDSYIYLRNEAQLLQGNNVGNSGLGQLSAYQTGTVNRYAYNYWCSPVGNNSALISNEAFRVELIDEATGLISSIDALFTGAGGYDSSTSPSLTIASPWLYTFVASDEYSEWNFVGQSGDIAPGLGFTMKGVGIVSPGSQLYDFRGKPNNGIITNTVAAPIAGDAQWTLVGNPYPSALDAFDFIWDSANQNAITGVLQYWEQAPGAASHYIADYVGGYALYTISNPGMVDSFTPAAFTTYLQDGTPTNFPAGSGSKIARRYIPIGQGFMVEGSVASTGIVYLRNSFREFYKESGTSSFFFRSEETNSNPVNQNITTEDGLTIVPNGFLRFRINVDLQNNSDFYTRQLLMNLVNYATDGFDYGLEAKSADVLGSDAHWVLDAEPYTIQAFSFDQELKIPLVITLDKQQNVRFRIFDIQNFDDSQEIYLHDKDAGLYVDLRQQDYDINLEIGNYTNRFEITFSRETLSVTEIEDEGFKVFQDNRLHQLTILNPNGLDIKNISLIDVSGKQIFSNPINGNNSEYNYSTTSLSVGVYIASITLKDAKQISKKVIITD